jgi:hypothetical protein
LIYRCLHVESEEYAIYYHTSETKSYIHISTVCEKKEKKIEKKTFICRNQIT